MTEKNTLSTTETFCMMYEMAQKYREDSIKKLSQKSLKEILARICIAIEESGEI